MCVIHKYVVQVNIMLMAFLINLPYNENLGGTPFDYLPVYSVFSINLLFSKIANILYAIFNNVIGL
jgi:hypothetical protein